MDTLNTHHSDDLVPERLTDSLPADNPESFEINVTTKDFLDDLGNISFGVRMNLGLHDAEKFRQLLSKVPRVPECTAHYKLPALAYISAEDITRLDAIVERFHVLSTETSLSIEELRSRTTQLIAEFETYRHELLIKYKV